MIQRWSLTVCLSVCVQMEVSAVSQSCWLSLFFMSCRVRAARPPISSIRVTGRSSASGWRWPSVERFIRARTAFWSSPDKSAAFCRYKLSRFCLKTRGSQSGLFYFEQSSSQSRPFYNVHFVRTWGCLSPRAPNKHLIWSLFVHLLRNVKDININKMRHCRPSDEMLIRGPYSL